MMNNNISSCEWKEFNMNDIFLIRDGYYNKKPPLDEGCEIPFLSATQLNNGVSEFYSKETIEIYDKVGCKTDKNMKDRFFSGNCIAITNNGSVGCAYYQAGEFTCSHDVTPVYLKNMEMSVEIAMFLIPILEQTGRTFGYAKKWRPKRMKKSKIILPVDDKNNPDWRFMENFIKIERKKQVNRVLKFYESRIEKLEAEIPTSLEVYDFKVFRFDKIFDSIQRGKRIKTRDHTKGNIPYVSSTAFNNGVDGFIGNDKDVRIFENNLSIANSGSVGKSFYHPYMYVGSDHITSLSLENATKYSYLYISTLTDRLKEKYSFNREINNVRMNKEKILLPTTHQKKIDFNYMEVKMKEFEIKILKDIIAYYKS